MLHLILYVLWLLFLALWIPRTNKVIEVFSILAAMTIIMAPLLGLTGIFTLWWLNKSEKHGYTRRETLAGLWIASGMGFALIGMLMLHSWGRHATARQTFSLVSLADRLAYEKPSLEVNGAKWTAHETPWLLKMEAELSPDGDGRGGISAIRSEALQQIHNHTEFAFVFAEGFGVSRMPAVVRDMVPLTKSLASVPIPQPARSLADDFYMSTWEPNTAPLNAPHLPPESQPVDQAPWETMHLQNLSAFAGSGRNGFAKNIHQVAGFQSHGLYEPDPKSGIDYRDTREIFQLGELRLQRLELVSLLKYSTPCVYVSEHLPTLDHPDDFQTRPLDTFETSALQRLQHGEDLVFAHQPHGLRMFGSLRAGQSCLDCHQVPRGTLLGAFTYRFLNTPPSPPVVQARKSYPPFSIAP